MSNPEISVIMSVYKEPIEWLRQSVDSILNQTFRDFEFIIVCDNPDYEEGIKTLKEYESQDQRIKLLFNEENIGLTKSLNKALAVAEGKYIARMDADDISMPTRFQKQYEYMESHPDVIVLGTDYKYIGDAPFFYSFLKNVEYGDENIKAHLLYGNCIAHSTVFIRKSILHKYRIKYDENFISGQDFRMWEILCEKGDFETLNEKLLKYRVSSTQITKIKPQSEVRQTYDINIRLILKWLDSINISSNYDCLLNCPYDVLRKVKQLKNIRKSTKYKMFIQFLYIEELCKRNMPDAIFTGDILYFCNQDKCLYLLNKIRKK